MKVKEVLIDQIVTMDTYQANLVESRIKQWVEILKIPVRVRVEALEEEPKK